MADILQGDIDLPGLGKTKRTWVYGGLGVAGAYVAWRWYQASRADEPPPGADGYYSTDQSELGLSTTGGTGNVTGNNNSSTDGTNPNTIDDNAEWTNKAVELLTNAGYDPAVIYGALGEFLARRALDKTEATIARAAIAAAGQPPVNGPFTVIEEAGTDTGTLTAPSGLKVVPSSATATVSWNAVNGASHYLMYRNDQSVAAPQKVTGTSNIMYNLDANREYKVSVAAVGTTGKEGPRAGQIVFKTTSVKLGKPGGLKASAQTRTSFTVSCTSVPGAQYYQWHLNNRLAGVSDKPVRSFTALKPGTSYKVTVAADTTSQNPGPVSSPITVSTKR